MSNNPRAVRRELTDADRIAIALDRLAVSKNGDWPTPLKELKDKYDRNLSVLTRAVQRAFKDGLVQVTSVKTLAEPQRMPSIERELKRRFHLESAIVIDPLVNRPKEPFGATSQQDVTPLFGDHVHEQLGRTVADAVATGPLFRDADRIGLGSGRAVYHVVRRLAETATVRARNVELVSLAGVLYARHHAEAEQPKVLVDADAHVQILASCFRQPKIRTVSHPLVYSNKVELQAVRKFGQPWKAENTGKSGKIKPVGLNLAIVGVGVLQPGHRMHQWITAGERDERLDAIRAPLKTLIDLCAKYSSTSAYYCPVGDVCNYLHYFKPPKGVPISARHVATITTHIEQINKRLLAIDRNGLKNIQALVLVAGTVRKAWAIRTVLANYAVRLLCTDKETAVTMLKITD